MMIRGPSLKTHPEPKKESKSGSKQYLYLKKWRKKGAIYDSEQAPSDHTGVVNVTR